MAWFKRDKQERSPSAEPIYRYTPRAEGFVPAVPPDDGIDRLYDHIERYVGANGFVYHELLSDTVHLDIHVVAPSRAHPFFTLVTTGMSDRPMTVPPAASVSPYAELLLCLPPTWPLGGPGEMEPLRDEDNYWPLRLLKVLARLPHEYGTWLGPGHSIPHGDPPSPFEPTTGLCGAVIGVPLLFEPGLQVAPVRADKTVAFYSVIPLYADEMQLKLDHGFAALVDLMEAAALTEMVDPHRPHLTAWPTDGH
jgi:hypothetical protein